MLPKAILQKKRPPGGGLVGVIAAYVIPPVILAALFVGALALAIDFGVHQSRTFVEPSEPVGRPMPKVTR
jgi:hypothetical protein